MKVQEVAAEMSYPLGNALIKLTEASDKPGAQGTSLLEEAVESLKLEISIRKKKLPKSKIKASKKVEPETKPPKVESKVEPETKPKVEPETKPKTEPKKSKKAESVATAKAAEVKKSKPVEPEEDTSLLDEIEESEDDTDDLL